MANKTLTAVDQWVSPKSVVNGDSLDASFDEACYQALADRTEYLKSRGIISNAEIGMSSGGWGSQTYGNAFNAVAGWDVLAAMSSTLSGGGLKAGTIVQLTACLHGKLSQAGTVLVRLARADNGGAFAQIGNAGAVFDSTSLTQRVLCATFALASDLSSCTYRVEALALNGACSLQLYSPCNMNVVVSRKTA